MRSALPEHFDVGEGYGKTSLERAGHLGDLRRLVPPPLHHRALRRSRRRRSRPTSWPRPEPRPWWPRPGCGSTPAEPVAALHLTDVVLAADPGDADARRVAAEASALAARRQRRTSGNGPGSRRSIDRLEAHVTNQVSFDFSEAAVLVTGGTSGIGHAIAAAFADAGAAVTVTGTRRAGDYDTDLARFSYRQVEMTDPASVDALIGSLGRARRAGEQRRSQLPRRARRVGARHLRHRARPEPRRPDAAHHRRAGTCWRPARSTAARAWSTWCRCPRSARSRSSPATGRPRPGWSRSPSNLARRWVARRHPGQRRRPRRHRHPDDGTDGALPRAARRRAGPHADGSAAARPTRSSVRSCSWPARRPATSPATSLVVDGGYLLP